MAKKRSKLDEILSDIYGYGFSDDSKTEALAEYTERANRLNAVSGVYQRADRIISRDSEITVTVVDDENMKVEASNNGRDIIFNSRLIEDISNDNIAHLHGLNYHELAHILFSPRQGSDLIRYVKDNKFKRAVNLLEEARAETMLVAKYPTTKLFLESATMKYLVDSTIKDIDVADQFPIITGRTYLPLEVRQAVADKFIAKHGADMAERFHALVHDYRTLVFPRDFDRAKELIRRMAELIGTDEEIVGCFPVPIETHDTTMGKGRPLGKAEQERLQDKISNNPAPTENMDGSNKSDTNKPNTNNFDDRGKGSGAGGDGTFSGLDREFTADDNELARYINERLSEINSDTFVKQTIDETRKAILGSDEVDTVIPSASYETQLPKPMASSLARRFGQELERIVRNSDPNWDKFNARGKLNITRTMNPDVNAIRSHFDTWDTGNPNTDIEAVILMDNSSSMGGLMQSVCETSWVIKRGVENINGEVTVFTFNHESVELYNKKEKAKPNSLRYMWASGGTNPLRALVETERILTASKKSIKIAFMVTDGEWGSTRECDTIIKSMKDKGILTVVVFLSEYGEYKQLLDYVRGEDLNTRKYAQDKLAELKHGADIFRAVTDNKQLLELAQEVVKSTLNTNKKVA